MKYINADRLCEDLMSRWEIADKEKEKEIQSIMADVVVPIVVGQPSSDVVEVKRGHWTEEYKEDEAPLFRWRWVCSACGDWNGYSKSKFCPNCGADMRERKEAE